MLSQLPQGFPEARELKSTAAPLKIRNTFLLTPSTHVIHTMAELAEWYDRIQIIEAQELLHVQQIWDLYHPHWIQLLMHILCTGHSGRRTAACPHTRAAPYAGRAGCLEPKLQRSFKTSNPTIIMEQITLLRVIPPDALCWHSFWHIIWKYTRHIYIYIYVCVCVCIFIYICVCIIIYIHTYTVYVYNYIATFYLTSRFWHILWHCIWHSFWHCVWHSTWPPIIDGVLWSATAEIQFVYYRLLLALPHAWDDINSSTESCVVSPW